MMLPIELGHRIEDACRLMIDFQLSPELDWFQGHFDNVPILPGFTQINWVMHHAKSLLGVDARFSGIDVVKLVIDDGSDAATANVLHHLAQQMTWVQLHRLPQKKGKGTAVMAGLRLAQQD
ncbi:glycosyltransferase [Edaphovirga cremea]|uniref:ApeI family dehydratase n=1 Tax=Edaphovirga cremea TaxID=2267246 RepID=UPI001FE824CB|nr:glycosyltransferase [Edaphovirga cremea]